MSTSWLETFLGRVSRPTYYRSNSTREIQEDFAKADLEETLILINNKIAYLERRRKDIVFIETIESTVGRRPITFPGYAKLKLSSKCHSGVTHTAANNNKSRSTSRAALVRQSDPFPYPMDTTHKSTYIKPGDIKRETMAGIILDSKTMMLENEGRIQWYKKLRDGVRAAMRIRARIYSAVYRCPLEVWSQIFIFCLPDNDSVNDSDNEDLDSGDSSYLEPSQDAAPLLLCRVCHSWRSAAIQTPALWCSLIVRLRTQPNRLTFLQTWVGRAGALALSLHIIWGPTQSLHFHDRTFDYLLTLVGRWKSIRLSVKKGVSVWQAHGFPTRAHKLLSYPMPQLEVLELEPYPSLNITSLQRNAPALKELRLTNGALNPMHLIVPSGAAAGAAWTWTQLAKFSSPFPLDMSDALRVFKACPNLVECVLKVESCPTSAECAEGGALALRRAAAGHAFLRMERLRKLVVGDTTPRVVDALFRMLILPNLEVLEVTAAKWSSDRRDKWAERELLLLVQRSSDLDSEEGDNGMKKSGLRKLKITGLNCNEEGVRNLVFGIASLVILDVRNGEMELSGKSWVDMLRKTKNAQ